MFNNWCQISVISSPPCHISPNVRLVSCCYQGFWQMTDLSAHHELRPSVSATLNP